MTRRPLPVYSRVAVTTPDPSFVKVDGCDLCRAARITPWYHEDDICWVAECEVCDVPMVVWRFHGSEPPAEHLTHMRVRLRDLKPEPLLRSLSHARSLFDREVSRRRLTMAGMARALGRIEPALDLSGLKVADLVLVEGDPSKRIGDLRHTRVVMMDGRLMDADALRKAAGFSGRPKN